MVRWSASSTWTSTPGEGRERRVSSGWKCRCVRCPQCFLLYLSCAEKGSTATPPVSASSPAACFLTARVRCRWRRWWRTSASRRPTPRRSCSTTRWRRTSTSSAMSCTNCVLRSADEPELLHLPGFPFCVQFTVTTAAGSPSALFLLFQTVSFVADERFLSAVAN